MGKEASPEKLLLTLHWLALRRAPNPHIILTREFFCQGPAAPFLQTEEPVTENCRRPEPGDRAEAGTFLLPLGPFVTPSCLTLLLSLLPPHQHLLFLPLLLVSVPTAACLATQLSATYSPLRDSQLFWGVRVCVCDLDKTKEGTVY